MEIWKDVVGYEGIYLVSNYGNIKRKDYRGTGIERMLKPSINQNGYLQLQLYKNGKRKNYLVHQLVGKAFIPNPNNLIEINHKDENPLNNKLENLEWCTRAYNNNYGTRTQRISKMVMATNKENKNTIIFKSISQAERELKIANASIIACCKGKRESAGGYTWEYI